MVELQLGAEVILAIFLILLCQNLPDLPRDLLGDLVNILGLDHRLQAILKQALDVRLELTASEVREDLLPVWRIVEAPKVWLQLPGENRKRGGLSDTVGAHQAQHLPWAWGGQAMQLEGVGAVPVSGVRSQVLGKVDDGDCLKRALLHANTASDAQRLRNEGDLRRRPHLDTELAGSDHGAVLLALLLALLWLAAVGTDDGNTQLLLLFLFHGPSFWGHLAQRHLTPTVEVLRGSGAATSGPKMYA
mmetsp:Transcript_51702/g.83883  ORF Transcript_51702/g.83883 Transcript_51702/m.83883 type:complete len:246 (+) Transcript_51702:1432-2169(+)